MSASAMVVESMETTQVGPSPRVATLDYEPGGRLCMGGNPLCLTASLDH